MEIEKQLKRPKRTFRVPRTRATAKDEYQSWAFNNTYIRFVRDGNGKVTVLKLHFSEEQYVEGTKKKNNR